MELLKEKTPGGIAFTWIRLAALWVIISIAIQVGRCEVGPTESQCRPYIEKALKEQQVGEGEKTEEDWAMMAEHSSKEENVPADELIETIDATMAEENEVLKSEESPREQEEEYERGDSEVREDGIEETEEDDTKDEMESAEKDKNDGQVNENETESQEQEEEDTEPGEEETKDGDDEESEETQRELVEEEEELEDGDDGNQRIPLNISGESREGEEQYEDQDEEREAEKAEELGEHDTSQTQAYQNPDGDLRDDDEANVEESKYDASETGERSEIEETDEAENEMQKGKESAESTVESAVREMLDIQIERTGNTESGEQEIDDKLEKVQDVVEEAEDAADEELKQEGTEADADTEEKETVETTISHDNLEFPEDEELHLTPEEDLTKEAIIPENLRSRDHITQILRLDEDFVETESILEKAVDSTLKSLKALYDNAIKPLEMLYKYRDLSNRHFGDPEIFSKPLILFMGPWSGGKSTTINYLLDNEFSEMSLRTGAEPSPAYFNIMMHGNEEEVLDGTQLAADWTFSGLQKFGQSLLDRLKGYKLPSRLLEKVNIVEIPGILEIRKQVQRLFPFNDACQWFIDRADIIFLVYDPSKLDVGPETEAILDQLKGREYQTRIILNKADQVKPEELMRVQGTLIWNISPLMSSTEPPVMYTTSLWSLPYESGAPTRLLSAQEKAFLRDLRDAIDKRVENKIASARRFAVRVRNHAKMVDCYLTTYYNHKTFFGNKKKISDDIIENPQKYHIYEGLSTLTNISRYDLPDPDVYKDFFKLNSLYDFKKLSDTCTYFRGCPINTLDVAIAYDLPELVGKYKKAVEASRAQTSQKSNR